MEESFITPTHVKDYVFCSMLFYNKYVRGILEPKTEMMRRGTQEYLKDKGGWRERKTLLRDKRIKVDKMLFAYPLASRKYRIHGIADTIFWTNNKMHILEIKYGESKGPFRDHLYQTATYALMAEEEFSQPVYKILIYYRRSKVMIEKRFTSQFRSHLIKIIEKIYKIFEGAVAPEPKITEKCDSCWYRKFCNP